MSLYTQLQSEPGAAMFSFEYKVSLFTVNKVTEEALIEQQHLFCIPGGCVGHLKFPGRELLQ
jgi:hypothetical protein